MSSSTLAIVIACISGAVSLASAFGGEQLRQIGDRARTRREQEVAEKNRAEEAGRIVARYRDPLLRSAYDLQSRIYNIYRPGGGFRGGRDPEYFRLNTLFLFAEFLAWLEIIRRDIQF